jgi:hypothetical protein
MAQIRVFNGSYRGISFENVVFKLAKPIDDPAKIQVINDGQLDTDKRRVFIQVKDSTAFEYLSVKHQPTTVREVPTSITYESDEDAMNRIASRFAILDQMTAATINGDIRAMIVSGPPGVGKSFGVEQQLEKFSLFDQLADKKIRYEIIKGAITPLHLYAQLYKFQDAKNVIVFDDIDSVFSDELSLNILKAALDSGKRRKIFWNSDSHMLRREGIPDNFDFKGSVIFITNLNLGDVKSKKMQDHMEALQSRCHYLDLTINDTRDKMLRIRQVHRDASRNKIGGLFADYDFEGTEDEDIMTFMWENRTRLREISLRCALKIADLIRISQSGWRELALITVCK